MTMQIAHKLFTADEYHSMIAAGILGEDDRVELIEGEICQMPAMGSRHTSCVKRLNHLFSNGCGGRVTIGVQDPVQLSDLSEPELDLSILKPRADYYAGFHPRPDDILLLVEVMDTTREFDRRVKLPLYASAGVTEVWLVDLEAGTVEVCRQPEGGGYASRQVHRRGDRLAAAALPELELAVEEILGSPR